MMSLKIRLKTLTTIIVNQVMMADGNESVTGCTASIAIGRKAIFTLSVTSGITPSY